MPPFDTRTRRRPDAIAIAVAMDVARFERRLELKTGTYSYPLGCFPGGLWVGGTGPQAGLPHRAMCLVKADCPSPAPTCQLLT